MRWLALYARSRQVPASLAAVVISAVAVGALAGTAVGGRVIRGCPVSSSLRGRWRPRSGSAGRSLSRWTGRAAIRWVPRRAAHVLLCGAVVGTVLLTVQAMGEDMATTAFVVRDSTGLMGLVALGAVLAGGQYAWTLPFAWLSFWFLGPAPNSAPMQVASWMLVPSGTTAAPGRPWSSRLPAPRPTPSRDRDGDDRSAVERCGMPPHVHLSRRPLVSLRRSKRKARLSCGCTTGTMASSPAAPSWSRTSMSPGCSATGAWPAGSPTPVGEIRRRLTYKTRRNGCRVVAADRWFPSSKTCSGCGAVKAKLPLHVRTSRATPAAW